MPGFVSRICEDGKVPSRRGWVAPESSSGEEAERLAARLRSAVSRRARAEPLRGERGRLINQDNIRAGADDRRSVHASSVITGQPLHARDLSTSRRPDRGLRHLCRRPQRRDPRLERRRTRHARLQRRRDHRRPRLAALHQDRPPRRQCGEIIQGRRSLRPLRGRRRAGAQRRHAGRHPPRRLPAARRGRCPRRLHARAARHHRRAPHPPRPLRQRAAVPHAGQRHRGLRDLHARWKRYRHQLEPRRPAHQGLQRPGDHRPALLALLYRRGSPQRAAVRGAACRRRERAL